MSQGSQLDQLFARFPDASPEDVADSVWLVALGVIREPAATTPPPTYRAGDPDTKHQGKGTTPPPITDSRGTDPNHGTQGKPGGQTTPPVEKPIPDPTRGDLLVRANDSQPQVAGSTAPRRSGEALRVPGGSPLPGAAQIARALRPFRRRVPSRHLQTLDIDATVHQIASRDIWHPVLRPSRARWFEIALVAEWSNSMALWTETVRAFRRVLERLGGFRDVRLWWVEKPATGSVILRSKPGSSPRSPRELVSPDGRRIVLFATDCLSSGWRQDAFAPLLKELGRRQPVALLQMLPRTWWGRTALAHADPVFVGSKCPGAPNQALSHEPDDPLAAARSRNADSDTSLPRAIPIPILTSEPELVAEWARLVCHGTKPSLPGVTFTDLPSDAPDSVSARATDRQPSTPTAEQRWKRFTSMASPTAIQLARLLAAAHLRMPIVRLIQTALLPESDQTHLAEVFLGGIVRRASPPDVVDPDRVQYAFHDGVAERLRANTPLDQMFDVHSLVSKYIENRYGAALHLEAILRTGEAPEIGADFEERSEFASVTADVLRRFGARYAGVASKIAPLKSTTGGETTGTTATEAAEQSKATSKGQTAAGSSTDATGKPPGTNNPEDEPLDTVDAQLAALEGARILWVDDEPANNTSYIEELRAAGVSVTIRIDTETALEVLHQSSFDAIISDLKRGNDAWAGLRFLEEVRSVDVAIPFAIFAFRVRPGMPELSEKGILVSSNNFNVIRRALAEALRGRPRVDQATHLPDDRRDELRQFLRQHNIYQRFSAEDNDADGLLQAEPSAYQWELLWAELWRQSASDTGGWVKALEFVRIATSARRVVVSRITGDLLEDVARHPEPESSEATSAPLAGRLLEAATLGTATWQGPRQLQSTLAIAIPDEAGNEAGPAGLLQIERASHRAFSPALTAWLRQLAGSLSKQLTAPSDEPLTGTSLHKIRIAGILSSLEELDSQSRTAILIRATYRHFQTIPFWNESSNELREARRYVERAEAASMTREAEGSFFADREAVQLEASERLAAAASGLPPETPGEIGTAVVLAAMAVISAITPPSQNRWNRELVEPFLVARVRDSVLTNIWLTALEMELASAREQSSPPAEA